MKRTNEVTLGGGLPEHVAAGEQGFAGDGFGDGLQSVRVREVARGLEAVEGLLADIKYVGDQSGVVGVCCHNKHGATVHESGELWQNDTDWYFQEQLTAVHTQLRTEW